MNRISLIAWLQITGPTFVTLVFGFSLLWNAQQAQSGSLLELQRSVGRLEGSISGLDARIDGLGSRIERLGEAVDALAKRLGSS